MISSHCHDSFFGWGYIYIYIYVFPHQQLTAAPVPRPSPPKVGWLLGWWGGKKAAGSGSQGSRVGSRLVSGSGWMCWMCWIHKNLNKRCGNGSFNLGWFETSKIFFVQFWDPLGRWSNLVRESCFRWVGSTTNGRPCHMKAWRFSELQDGWDGCSFYEGVVTTRMVYRPWLYI